MEELGDSGILEDNLIAFLRKLLAAPGPSGLTAFENKLAKRRPDVVALDQALDRKLVPLLLESKEVVSAVVALQLLLYSHKAEQLPQAKEMLHIAKRDKITLTRDAMREVLRDSRELPVAWAMGLSGELGVLRTDAPEAAKPMQLPQTLP